jgi:hypothetical protein
MAATPLEIFRILATEFSSISDDTVSTWIELTVPLVSQKRFGRVYNQALALYTAHRMKLAGVGSSSEETGGGLSDLGGADVGLKIASYTSGGESISFNTGTLTTNLSDDAEYAQTEYGVQYLNLRRLYIIPIINAGERC